MACAVPALRRTGLKPSQTRIYGEATSCMDHLSTCCGMQILVNRPCPRAPGVSSGARDAVSGRLGVVHPVPGANVPQLVGDLSSSRISLPARGRWRPVVQELARWSTCAREAPRRGWGVTPSYVDLDTGCSILLTAGSCRPYQVPPDRRGLPGKPVLAVHASNRRSDHHSLI